jgi:hypothetical protein
MPIPVEAYTDGGVVRGVLACPGHLRDALEAQVVVEIERATVVSPGLAPRPEGSVSLEPDDILLGAEPLDAVGPVHALWHPLHLAVGPYLVDGELPTMPGFDPAKALARPTGTFVLLRDARVALASDPATLLASHPALLVNRYTVERVEADLMLAFFFPGAEMTVDEALTGAAAHQAASV